MSNHQRYALSVTFIVSLGGFLFGFDASVISGVNGFIKPQFGLSDIQLGWVVSSPTFAATFAMLVSGKISDFFGRRSVLIAVAILYTVSAVFSAIASGYIELVVARMIGGLAFGAALILAPVYIAEIASPDRRGQLVSINQLNIVVGFSAAYFCNYLFNNAFANESHAWYVGLTDQTVWRWMLGIEAVPALGYVVLLCLVPRSPRWLLMKGREQEAEQALKRLCGPEQFQAIRSAILESMGIHDQGAWSALFSRSMRLILIVALVIAVLQQITGINAVFFYATTIFEKAGFSNNASFAQAVWVGLINVFATLLAMVLIDRIGRKPLLIIGVLGVAISLMVAGYGFSTATFEIQESDLAPLKIDPSDTNVNSEQLSAMFGQEYSELEFKSRLSAALGDPESGRIDEIAKAVGQFNSYLILAGILGFVASFAISLGPVMWVLLSELFPNRVRGLAISFAGFVNSSISWLVTFVFPWELRHWGSATTFFIYAAFAVVGLFLILVLLPETKGKSLEQLEADLAT